MRKTKKAVASLAIAGMVLSMAPMSVFGATTDSNRLAGAGRVETAIAVANQGWANGADSVIVVPADDANIVDALAAAPLAGQLKAPILVTYKDALDPQVQQKIKDLGAKNVYAVGALSADTVASLKAISGVTVTALQGADRTDTAAKVAAQLTNVKGSFVVAYNGTADALSAASFAAANGYSIVVSNPDGSIPASEKVVAPVYTVGGQAKYDGATKLAGADRYATNDAVNNGLTFQYDKVYVANGETLVDALAGAPLAAQTNSPIVLADATKAATGVNDNLTDSSKVIALGGTGAVSDAVLGQVNKSNTGVVSVSSVKAASANSIKVAFTTAPADTSKVAFTVKRDTTPVTVTTTWNDAKTEATLTGSANFPEGNYSVGVKNDTTDLGTSTLSITAQKLAKINITSSKLGIVNAGGIQTGYATYNAQDQYGNDVTSSTLASGIQFQTGLASAPFNGDHGLIKFTVATGLNAISFPNAVITASDSNSGVTASATLTVSTQVGTLSNFKLTTLTNPDGKSLTAGDSSIFYANYEATDLSGNPTNNLELIKGGLITFDNTANGGLNADGITCTSPYVNANIVADPADSKKAVIQVKVKNGTNINMDMPVTITAMSWTGTTSSLNTTLKKAATADKLTLMAPSYDIAANDTNKAIPFVAYDQNGNQLTKASEITGVNYSPNVTPVTNVDGTLSLLFNPNPASKGQQVITAMTSTGNYSTLTINVQDNWKASTLTVDPSVLVSTMEANGAVQKIDAGYKHGGLTVKDQYGRAVNINTATTGYEVIAKVLNGNGATITGGPVAITGSTPAEIVSTANAESTTIEFDLVAKATPGTIIDSKTVQLSTIASADIKDYTIDSVANPIYTALANNAASLAGADDVGHAYAANPVVYGKTSAGSKVVLAGSQIIGVNSSNSTDFVTDFVTGTPVASDSVYLAAKKFTDSSKTSASTTLTVTILDTLKNVHTVSTAVTSKTDAPVPATLAVNVDKSVAGVTTNSLGDVITLSKAAAQAQGLDGTGYLTRYNPAGVKNAGPVYFYTTDQYGTKATALSQVIVSSDTVALAAGGTANGTLKLNADGTINTAATVGAAGDVETITLSGVTSNGLVKTIKIVINW